MNDRQRMLDELMARASAQATPQPGIVPDPDYELVPAKPEGKKGVQCGKCGMKFDHNKVYGYACMSPGCPMGMGGTTC
ncbi:hypothetical protein [Azospirillum picis]|uniref:Uncharacterized protein n=1 Tax=Azospirillum picis TaxID=488438 RepID=A0ABU0MQA1_9PROT|nr:hypothetical protein [Azospirillum picis]MBP2301562.1 hypothetical protein [Azospirillum picis]MDQ0535394.1 hypothetical protein [Azospirillum picis]